MDVQYRVIPRVPRYEAGNDGTIRNRSTKKARKFYRDDKGYLRVGIWVARPGRNSETCLFSVHRLVLEAFVGPRPEGMECRHLDGNPANNRLDNLAWGTRQEQLADKRCHGTIHRPKGSLHPNAKLDETRVREIFRLDSVGVMQKNIAASMNVSFRTISTILLGGSWKHLGLKRGEAR